MLFLQQSLLSALPFSVRFVRDIDTPAASTVPLPVHAVSALLRLIVVEVLTLVPLSLGQSYRVRGSAFANFCCFLNRFTRCLPLPRLRICPASTGSPRAVLCLRRGAWAPRASRNVGQLLLH
ncbi:hypothetical protein TRVL_06169 [Trypanosoma vivax]|nr:hypothetical protein TRVL_06169 [Trypanosoma vivax]